MFFEICGWLGCILLAVCGAPEAYVAFKNKRTGLTWALIIMWFVGEILAGLYCVNLAKWPLVFNYTVNIIILLPVLWYKTFPGKKDK